jgi:hypothetical protein
MDLDSIIYIVIAIVLAIINAVAQKKKKATQQQTPQQAPASEIFEDDMGDEHIEEIQREPIKSFQDIIREMANDSFAEDIMQITSEPKVQQKPLDFVEEMKNTSEIDTPVSPLENYVENYKPLDIPEGAIDSIGEYDYNSTENSISSSAISDALTEEEEKEKMEREINPFIKNFSSKDAILYSEIIKPKYF